MASGRNLLFIIIDQLRADCLTGALAAHVDLPNLRALTAGAVTFGRHYSVTNPCGPSRASILTGRYAMNHRSVRNGTPLADGIPNLAGEMRRAGYEPMLFGYTDTSLDPRSRAPGDPDLGSYERVLPGFAERLEMRLEESYPWRAHLKARGYEAPRYPEIFRPKPASDGAPPRLGDPAFYAAEDSDTAFLTDAVLRDLSARTDERWFVHVTYIRPHPPFVAPEPYNRMVDPAALPAPVRRGGPGDEAAVHPYFAAYLKHFALESQVVGFEGRLDAADDAQIAQLRATYLGLAAEVDHHLGRLMAFLRETGQDARTLVVVTSDHGEMLGDRYLWGKQTVYEAAFHVPLIIRDPDLPDMHGRRVDAFTESVDLAPTLLDWAGQAVPPGMDGASLMPFLRDETPADWRDHVYAELDFGDPERPTVWQRELGIPLAETNLAILRGERFKLIHFNGGLPPLLFDMASPEGELQDLAGDPAHGGTLLAMTRALLDHRMRHAGGELSRMKITPRGVVNFPHGAG